LLSEGRIRSICVRSQKGAQRGVRLIDRSRSEYSSNPATSRRLIERNRRLAKNNSSELSRLEDSNSELLKIATVTSQKEQSRTAKNGGALLLEKVPTENTNRKTTTTNPDLDNENGNRKKPAEASSRRCSSSLFSVSSGDQPAAALGDQLAAEVAEEFGLSSNQRQRVTEFFESHGQGYVRSKAEIVRSEPRKNAAGALLAALRDDWQPPVPVSPAVDTEVEHLASSDDLARRMAWQW
jgi:hypothetical protein